MTMIFLLWRLLRQWQCALVACASLLLLAPTAGAQSLDQRLLEDVKDGRLEHFDFLSAALIASGVADPCELDIWQQMYAEFRGQIVDEQIRTVPADERLAVIHAALHERILVGTYHTTATDLRTTLSRGDFNCLSALALYLDLCREAGAEMDIWLVPGHVYLQAPESGMTIQPVSRRASPALKSDVTKERPLTDVGSARRDARHSTLEAARQITPVELLGKFYYNRGVQLLHERRFATGLALLQISVQLDPADRDARENLLAGLNNWAVEHCHGQRFGQAAALIEQGLALEPTFAPLVANEQFVRGKLHQ